MKRPSFQFYPGDFLSDHNVIGMSMEERGAYITLLCICWDQGHLPIDDKALARYLNGTSMDLSFVVGCFTEKDGVLVHKRLMEERQKQDDYKKRCSKGGKQSQQNQRDKKSLPSGLEVPCNTSSPSSPSSTSVKDKLTMSEKEKFALVWGGYFDSIWERYPLKRGKEKAKRHFKAQVLTFQDWENIEIALDAYVDDMDRIRSNGHPDRAWQHGGTWFNGYWKDFINYEPPANSNGGLTQQERDFEI